jgi:hypothetical protein
MKNSVISRSGEPSKPQATFQISVLLLMMFSVSTLVSSQGKRQKVIDSILGVRIGATREEAHRKLKSLGKPGGEDAGERGEEEDAEARREGGRQEAWALRKTEFGYIVYRMNEAGRVKWVSGFVRPGREIPFAKLGDLSLATTNTATEVIWNVETPEGGYRLVAKGPQGKARVVYLFSLATPPVR